MDGEDNSRCSVEAAAEGATDGLNELFHEEQMDEMPEPRHMLVSPTPNILTSKPFWTVCLRHDAGGGT